MISQTDATLGPTTTTTDPLSTLNHHIHPHPTSTTIHNAKGSKSLTAKKRKKYDETIIDDFAIIAFKTWEDLQDELNERTSSLNNSSNNNNSLTNVAATTNSSEATFNYDNSLIASDKKVKSKLKSSSNSSSASSANLETVSLLNNSSTTTATSTNTNPKDGSGHKKKDRAKKSVNSHSSSKVHVKDKRNKTTSSDTKTTLKRALEAKELAEKRLSIIEEKLKQEQIKNRINNNYSTNINNISNNNNVNDNIINSQTNDIDKSSSISHNSVNTPKNGISKSCASSVNNNNNNVISSSANSNSGIQQDIINQHPIKTSSIHVTEVHYSNPQAPTTHIIKEEIHQHPRANGILSHELFEDPTLAHKAAPYTPFHINSHLYRPSSVAIHHLQQQQQPHIRNAPSPPRIPPHINSLYHQATQNQHQLPPKHTSSPFLQQSTQHSIPSSAQNMQYHSAPPPSQVQQALPSQSQMPPNQPQSLYQRPPHPSLIQYQQSQPPLNPYSHTQPNSIMSPMSLSSLPQSYSCSPSIFITDTFSRQTSIVPPPPQALGHVLDSSATTAAANRFGHTNLPHSITPSTPPVPPSHHMFYPPLPTERSFRELARSYINPGHLGYPNLMNTLPTPSPTITASPYSFERWSRMTLDQQRAVSIYNSLYQSNTTLPDRTFASYTSTRPSFPAGPFPPPS